MRSFETFELFGRQELFELGLALTDLAVSSLGLLPAGEVDAQAAFAGHQLDEVTREEVLLARLVGVNAGYVRSVRDAGYCPSLTEFVALKIAGIDRQYLQDMASEGYVELPVEALVELRASGVDKEVIHEMEEQGIHTPTVEEMVEFKSEHGPVPK